MARRRNGILSSILLLFSASCSQNPAPQPAVDRGAEAKPAAAPASAAVPAPDPDPWPKVLDGESYRVELYPPQVESWDGLKLTGVSAVVAEKKAKGDQGAVKQYGSVAFTARTLVDKEERLVAIDQLVVDKVAVPSAPDREAKLADFVQKRFGSVTRVVSLDRLEAAAAASSARAKAVSHLVKNEPPAIRIVDRPALLVSIDGAPVWREVPGTS